MKKIIGILIIGLITNILMGCATTENFDQAYSSWVGLDSEELLRGWGKPTQVIKLANGNTEYVYNLSRYSQLPDACVVYFEADQQTGKIIRIRHEGNRCKRAPSFV